MRHIDVIIATENFQDVEDCYDPEETEAIIENGMKIATKGEDKRWSKFLGCVFLAKMGTELPPTCEACHGGYCTVERDKSDEGQSKCMPFGCI